MTVLVYLDDLNHLAGTALGVRMGAELTSKMLYLRLGWPVQVRPLRWKICLLSCAWFDNIN